MKKLTIFGCLLVKYCQQTKIFDEKSKQMREREREGGREGESEDLRCGRDSEEEREIQGYQLEGKKFLLN